MPWFIFVLFLVFCLPSMSRLLDFSLTRKKNLELLEHICFFFQISFLFLLSLVYYFSLFALINHCKKGRKKTCDHTYEFIKIICIWYFMLRHTYTPACWQRRTANELWYKLHAQSSVRNSETKNGTRETS